jgi:hypothetical protein
MLPGGGVGLGLADFLFLYRIRRSEAQHFLDTRESSMANCKQCYVFSKPIPLLDALRNASLPHPDCTPPADLVKSFSP